MPLTLKPTLPANKTSSLNALCDQLSDADIVARIKAGELPLFELLMRRYNQRLFRLARSVLTEEQDAMDAVQNAYLTAYTCFAQLHDHSAVGPWLSRIVYNEALGRLRHTSRHQSTAEIEMHDVDGHDDSICDSEDNSPLKNLANLQLRQALEQAVDELPLTSRSVFMLRGVQQLSTRETALSLDLSEEVVKVRYARAKQKLQEILSHKILSAGVTVHEFAGWRCDLIVNNVMAALLQQTNQTL